MGPVKGMLTQSPPADNPKKGIKAGDPGPARPERTRPGDGRTGLRAGNTKLRISAARDRSIPAPRGPRSADQSARPGPVSAGLPGSPPPRLPVPGRALRREWLAAHWGEGKSLH